MKRGSDCRSPSTSVQWVLLPFISSPCTKLEAGISFAATLSSSGSCLTDNWAHPLWVLFTCPKLMLDQRLLHAL